MNKYILSIDTRLKSLCTEQGSLVLDGVMENVSKNLPLKSTEEIENFEILFEKDDFKTNFVSINYKLF